MAKVPEMVLRYRVSNASTTLQEILVLATEEKRGHTSQDRLAAIATVVRDFQAKQAELRDLARAVIDNFEAGTIQVLPAGEEYSFPEMPEEAVK